MSSMWCLFVLFNLALKFIDANSLLEDDQQSELHKDGYVSGFIANGQPARKFEYPWLVALANLSKIPRRIFCGGAIISEIMIITVSGRVFSILNFNKII